MPADARERLLVLLDALTRREPGVELPVPDLWEYVRAYRAAGEELATTQTDVLLLLRSLVDRDLVEKQVPNGYRLSAAGEAEARKASDSRPEAAERASRAIETVAA